MNTTSKYLIANTIYGTISLFLHFIDASSEFVVLCRGSIGSLFIVLIMLLNKDYLDIISLKVNLKHLIISGAAFGFNWVALFAGYRYGTMVTSLCNYTAPIIVTLISIIFLREKVSFKNIIYILMSFTGIVLISGVIDSKALVDVHCLIYGMLAALGFVILVLENRKLKEIKPLDKTVTQLLISALVVLPYVFLNNGFPNSLNIKSLILVIIMGVIHTGLAYIFYFNSIDVLPISKVVILGYIEPVLSILIGIFIFKEKITILGIIGAILIIMAAILNELDS